MVTKKTTRGRPPDPALRARRRQELVEAAFDLFLARGLDGVTIDQIVAMAGQAKGGFYRHFENKDALVEAVYAPLTRDIRAAFTELAARLAAPDDDAPARAAYEQFALTMSGVLLRDQPAARLYLQERRGPNAGARRPIADLATYIEEQSVATAVTAKERGLLRDGDPEVVGHAVIGVIEQVLLAYLQGRIAADGGQVASELTRMVLRGLVLIGGD